MPDSPALDSAPYGRTGFHWRSVLSFWLILGHIAQFSNGGLSAGNFGTPLLLRACTNLSPASFTPADLPNRMSFCQIRGISLRGSTCAKVGFAEIIGGFAETLTRLKDSRKPIFLQW